MWRDLRVLGGREDVVKLALQHQTLGQRPVAVLLVDKDDVLQHSLHASPHHPHSYKLSI